MAHYFVRLNFSFKLEHVFCGHIAFVHDGMGKIHIFPKLLCTARPRDTRILVPEKNCAAQNRAS